MKVYVKPSQIGALWLEKMMKRFPEYAFETNLANASDAEVIIATPSFLSKKHLDSFTNLRWIQLVTAGFDVADLEYVASRKILVTNAQGVYSIPLAEDIVAKILALSRFMRSDVEKMQRHQWKAGPMAHELFGSTIGFLGTGSIAQEAAKRLRPFKVRLLGYRREIAKLTEFDEIFVGEAGLEIILHQSDYIVMSLPLNQRTKGLMNYQRFAQMKPTAMFINHGRGEVVVQEDLIKALQESLIAGAALDVASPEPLAYDSPLWEMSNVWITPHSAGVSSAVYERLYGVIAENLQRFSKTEPLKNIIKP